MTLGEFLASQYLTVRDSIAMRFRIWLGRDAKKDFPKDKWEDLFERFRSSQE